MSATPDPADRDRAGEAPARDRRAGEEPRQAAASIDEMVEESFPASDPPASWTWEVPRPKRARRD